MSAGLDLPLAGGGTEAGVPSPLLGSHERALLIVADTENKAADAINVSLWLSVVAIVIAVLALALEVLA